MTVTAYCPCAKCTPGKGKTASGRDAKKDGVAVDKRVIPLGSRLDVPGAKTGSNGNGSWLLADDTGSAIVGDVIDVRMQSHDEAKRWGRKELRVRIWRRN
jgi:3D (Asp-Asp-Asp) domain-containing protein